MTTVSEWGASLTRRRVLGALGATTVMATGAAQAASPAILTGKGDIRSVNLVSRRLGERLKLVYWIEGEYIPEALAEIDHLFRDWREDESIIYNRRAIDVIAGAHRLLDTDEPYNVVSAYRTTKTNNALRRRNRGVASKSYHTLGMAVDVTMQYRSVGQMYRAAMACRGGGVGRYTRSKFVHMDCGPVRTWGR